MRESVYSHWCLCKHLLLARVHLEETLQKWYQSCDSECPIDRATREELIEAIKNLLAAEEHVIEATSQSHSEELRKILRELRTLRQAILLTGMLSANKISKDRLSVFEDAVRKLSELFERARSLPQAQEVCERCLEDVGKLREEYAKALEMQRHPGCRAPKAFDEIEGVLVLAEDDDQIAKLRSVVESDAELRRMLVQARDRGLTLITISCEPQLHSAIAHTLTYHDGSTIHLHPVVLEDKSCLRHALAHELAHALGVEDERRAEQIADRFGRCELKVKRYIAVRTQRRTMASPIYIPLGGAFVGKGVQMLGKHVVVKMGQTGRKPHQRADFYIDLGTSVASTVVAYLHPDRWYGMLALGMACKVLPDMIDYALEYLAPAPARRLGAELTYYPAPAYETSAAAVPVKRGLLVG